MKALIIGTGSIARRHSTILKESGFECIHLTRRKYIDHDSTEIINLYSNDDLPLKFHNYFDLAVISGAPNTREKDFQISYNATKINSKITIEKPLISWKHCNKDPFIGLENRSFYTLFNVRYHREVEKIKCFLSNCDKLNYISLKFHDNVYNWYGERIYDNYVSNLDHGGVLNISCHEIDLLLYITKTTPKDWKILEKKECLNSSNLLEDTIELKLLNPNSNIEAFISLSLVSKIRERFIEIHSNQDQLNLKKDLDYFDENDSWANTYTRMWKDILYEESKIFATGFDGILISKFCSIIKQCQ